MPCSRNHVSHLGQQKNKVCLRNSRAQLCEIHFSAQPQRWPKKVFFVFLFFLHLLPTDSRNFTNTEHAGNRQKYSLQQFADSDTIYIIIIYQNLCIMTQRGILGNSRCDFYYIESNFSCKIKKESHTSQVISPKKIQKKSHNAYLICKMFLRQTFFFLALKKQYIKVINRQFSCKQRQKWLEYNPRLIIIHA